MINKYNLKRNLSNIPGWRTDRKIVVFESDDWGSVRMPSMDAFNRLKKKGIDLESGDYYRYNLNDTLECSKDLQYLFEVLDSFKDMEGNPVVFTALCVLANPDFSKIKESGFKDYFYEPFTKTLERYYPAEDVFQLWKEGISHNLFIPQFHGREHLNVPAWIKALRSGHKITLTAFDEGFWGFVPDIAGGVEIEILAAFQITESADLEKHKEILIDGLNLFATLFGYRARYFVPPNGHINNKLNKTLADNGIELRSTAKIQYESIGLNKTKRVINWLGKKDKSGIRYITRNCFFEPNQKGNNWIDSCLNDIRIAFKWQKPAIISSHRVNYIGVHNPKNRDNSLNMLRLLLKTIKNKWPDAEFMSTDKLGGLLPK